MTLRSRAAATIVGTSCTSIVIDPGLSRQIKAYCHLERFGEPAYKWMREAMLQVARWLPWSVIGSPFLGGRSRTVCVQHGRFPRMSATRRQGLKLLVISGALTVVTTAGVMWLTRIGWTVRSYAVGIPGAFFLAGLIQLVSGVPFAELAERWDGLHGWQRGVLGTLIVLLSAGVIFGILAIFLLRA